MWCARPKKPAVSSSKADPSPFDLGGDARSSAAVLCLHGLTGTPYEVRPLGEALAQRGVRAFGPALPGHNETPEQLARTRHQDWVGAAREHVTKLRSGHERVFAVGMSMGGLVSLALAAEGAVDALVVVGTPLRLPRLARWTLPVLKYVRPFLPKRQGSDVREREAWARHPSYTVTPLRSAHELVRLGRRVVRGLPDVTCPILVAHGAHDRTAQPQDARAIYEGVGSPVRELLILEHSGHVVPVDHDGPDLARATGDFLTRFL